MRFILSILLISSFLFAQEFRKSAYQEQEQRNIFDRNQKAGSPFPNMRSFRENEQRVEYFNASNPFIQTQSNDEVWEAGWETDNPIYRCTSKAVHVDEDSNIFVISEVYDIYTKNDVKIIKTNNNGAVLWTYTYDEPETHYDRYASSFLKNNGNLLVIVGSWRIGSEDVLYKQITDPDYGYIYFWLEFSSSGELITNKDMLSRDYVGLAEFTSFAFNNDGSFYATGKRNKIMSVDSTGNIVDTYFYYDGNRKNPKIQTDSNGDPYITYFRILNDGLTNKLRVQKFTKDLRSLWYYEFSASYDAANSSVKSVFDYENNIIILNNRDNYPTDESYLVKLNPDGSFLMEKKLAEFYHYSEHTNMLLDSRDQIYLPNDFDLTKFDPDFNLLWQSDSGEVDYISGIDENDNILTFGYTQVSKFDNSGNKIWFADIDRRANRRDHYTLSSTVFINDYFDDDNYSTVCRLLEVNSQDYLTELNTFKGNGNIFYKAVQAVLSPNQDLFILSTRYYRDLYLGKVDSAGNFLWEKRLTQNDLRYPEEAQMKLISNNRILVTWYHFQRTSEPDKYYDDYQEITICIYDLNGVLLKKKKIRFNYIMNMGPPNCLISSNRIHYMIRENINLESNRIIYKFNHITFDFDGNQLTSSSGSWTTEDVFYHYLNMAVDADNNTAILFHAYNENDYSDSFYFWWIDKYGQEQFIQIDPSLHFQYPRGKIFSDKLDGFYLIFTEYEKSKVTRITADGKLIWTTELSQFQSNLRIAIDHKGTIYSSSWDRNSNESQLIRIDRTGEVKYRKTFQNSNPGMLNVVNHRSLALANGGNIPDLSLIELETGDIISHYTFTDSRGFEFGPLYALSNNADDIYLLGNSDWQYMNLFKFNEDGLQLGGDYSQSRVVLAGNYPNPFNGTTNIQYSLPSAGQVNIEIYNSIGQKVDSYSEVLQEGPHNYPFKNTYFSSGIYFYSIKFKGAVATGKMVFVK